MIEYSMSIIPAIKPTRSVADAPSGKVTMKLERVRNKGAGPGFRKCDSLTSSPPWSTSTV